MSRGKVAVVVFFIIGDDDDGAFQLYAFLGWPWILGFELPLNFSIPFRSVPFSSFATFSAIEIFGFTVGSSSPTLLSGPGSRAGIVPASLSDAHPSLLSDGDGDSDGDGC